MPGVLLCCILLSPLVAAGLRDAEEALERNDFATAANLASALVKSEPRNPAVHVILARARIGQNEAVAALNELETALRINPRDVDALYYTDKLTGVLARLEFTRLQRIAPDSGRVHQLLAESLRERDDTAGEEREYKAALQQMPNSTTILTALGDLLRYHARYEDALLYYARAEKADKRNFDALYGLGATEIFQEDYRSAVQYLQRALEVEPHSAAARLALGDALLRDQKPAEAVKILSQLVADEPQAKQSWALFGKALRQAGQKAEADAAFARYRKLLQAEAESPAP